MSTRLRDSAPGTRVDYGRLLTIREAAARLGVSRTMLYSLMDTGAIAYVRVGADRRISEAAIDRYIAANTVGGAR